ncbi:nuclear transport factor 2 family protein [Virgibacillus sp. Bac332]|uniref:nuclear transport factor 2 family protein n=1 Tax=Virgibacillus sp. Bac332 TaxID=2419842 RepID=UPI000EF4D54F|nr:nuclear transport factor 2 family protein [Virgibacillus sp. Bac332]
MNKKQAYQFFTEVYQEIIVNLNINQIPEYFSEQYIQVTDGVRTNMIDFTNHIVTLKEHVASMSVSPFYDFLFDKAKQTVTLRYIVHVNKKNGETGDVEVIAIFELANNKIIRCNEMTCPLSNNKELENIGTINTNVR